MTLALTLKRWKLITQIAVLRRWLYLLVWWQQRIEG
jgi:hypothetical protein